jgi:sialate O-acetylesterase
MKKLILKCLFLFTLATLLFSCEQSVGNDYRTVVKLNGYWKFSIGDDSTWSSPSFNDESWESIYTPKNWERQGYVGYDGFAWYRKTLFIPSVSEKSTLFLHLGNIDDADEVYLNGKLIGKTGEFPPNYASAYNWSRDYIIPVDLIRENAQNVIAIRVYDSEGEGGLCSSNISIRVNENEDLLNVNLAGDWKFKLYDNTSWKDPNLDDSSWEILQVPMSWEAQNHFDYDGYAWYRKTFTLPNNLEDEKLYLVLGKIDDYDRVYLNGEIIGEVSPKRSKSEMHTWGGNEYNTFRIYRIPKKVLKDGINSIAVRVYDGQQLGGIYEGPIGIMTEKNMREFKNSRHSKESDIINNIFSSIFDNNDNNNYVDEF